MGTTLSGTVGLLSANEGVALPNNFPAAFFTDSNSADTAADFTASINWGDGTIDSGAQVTVVGSNGSFTVEGNHTYNDELVGAPFSVTLTRTADNTTAMATGPVSVNDEDNLGGGPPVGVVSGNPGQALTNVTVAQFGDNNPNNVAGDFTATIDWGDGTTTTGTVSGAGAALTVKGSHTYATAGGDFIVTTLTDDTPGTASATVGTPAAIGLFGTVLPLTANENVALPSNFPVAFFTDSNMADTQADFTATINWGDGTIDSGAQVAVVDIGGALTVEGTHTYSDELVGAPLSVTLTRTTDNTTATATGTVSVNEEDNLGGGPPVGVVSGNPGQALTDVTVATFGDNNPNGVAGDFTATINWGDGTTSTGTVSGGVTTFTVKGSHTYATAGGDFIVTTLTDDTPGTASATVGTPAAIGIFGTVPVLTATEGTPLPNGFPVAFFTDSNSADTGTDFTATINWGDGTIDSGAQVAVVDIGGALTVFGNHTYSDELIGAPLSVTLTRTTDNTTATATGIANVSEGDTLLAVSLPVQGDLALNNVPVAIFANNDPNNVAGDFTATINWGDGTTDAGAAVTIAGSNGTFTVDGSHTYATGGVKSFSVTVADDAPGTAIAKDNGTATVGLYNGLWTLFTTSINEGLPVSSGPVAQFSDGDLGDTAAAFKATIDWGDGTSSPAQVLGASGLFLVVPPVPHFYADEGFDQPKAIVTRAADNSTLTIVGFPIFVNENDSLVVTANNLTGNPGLPFSNVQVATFTTGYHGNTAGDFIATIHWGDGTTTAGTVAGGNGSFTVTGSHTYTVGGNDTFNVTVLDDPPLGMDFAGDSATATINFPGTDLLAAATEGTALANTTALATFSDSDLTDQASAFTATINWGDGTNSAGSVTGSNGSFTVEGGHTYAEEGNDQASVILIRTSDQAMSTVSGAVSVAEADVLAAHGMTFSATAKAPFNGAVATFTDVDTVTPASDFLATVAWGDGTTTVGTVTGSNGSFTVGGAHTYATHGQDTVTVTVADDATGTASATVTGTAIVANTAPFDFNGDAISDLAFQQEPLAGQGTVAGGGTGPGSTGGTPQIWLWNGTAVTTRTMFPNPGASWHIVTSRDVNGDGKADLIWQNSDGTPGIWLMNGTTPIAEDGLTNPGSSWHIVAAGDLNGDGDADFVWQNTDGTLGVWLMNGTTPTAEAGIGNPGPNWKVVGSADLNADGRDDILLQNTSTGNLMMDLMNGTSVSSTVSITVGDPSWRAVSTGEFNGQAEIAWQNNNGTVGIWLMNGTSPAAEAALANPGTAWQLVSIDHFTPNGQADLLFQNTNGAMGLWEMNGASVATTLNLPNPGAGWQSVNGHPFATG